MSNLYLPGSALFISAFLLIVYCSKERIKIKENNIYLGMLICILLDSLCVLTIFINSGEGESLMLIKILNRVDYMILVTWSLCLCRYTHTVIYKKDEKNQKRHELTRQILVGINLVECVVIWLLRLDAIVENGITQSIIGPAVYFTFACCALHIILCILFTLLNTKNVTKQITPVYMFVLITFICAAAYYIDPSISGVSLGLTIVNLTMYFTIENPDVQMLEKVNMAKEQAQKANRAKTDFLSSMSHEIRTPINAITGFAECIRNDTSLEAAKEDALNIITASETLLELVNGILDISKIEAGRMELVNKEYDLILVAENLTKLINSRIGEKPIELRSDFSDRIPGKLFGDESKVRQIMTNLLTNAVKYTEKGYIDFKIDCVNDDVSSELTITVADSGHGIKEEALDGLFDKFRRLEEDKNSNIEGTGLGLAITKQFVEMLGGSISVQSSYGVGSTFTVKITQEIRDFERTTELKVEEAKREYPGHKILVVDDTVMNLKVAQRVLELYKIEADTASSGQECIDKCRAQKYEIVFLDDMMPVMSGTQTLQILKEIPAFDTPVVVFTANAIEGMSEKYLDAGFADYLSKPIVKNELGRVLEKLLS